VWSTISPASRRERLSGNREQDSHVHTLTTCSHCRDAEYYSTPFLPQAPVMFRIWVGKQGSNPRPINVRNLNAPSQKGMSLLPNGNRLPQKSYQLGGPPHAIYAPSTSSPDSWPCGQISTEIYHGSIACLSLPASVGVTGKTSHLFRYFLDILRFVTSSKYLYNFLVNRDTVCLGSMNIMKPSNTRTWSLK
jgi:hypothetical protein